MRSQDHAILKENGEWLKANPHALLWIEGHMDERGTNEYSLGLGERRTKATRGHVERPLCAQRTEACWARNRRAHFLVKP